MSAIRKSRNIRSSLKDLIARRKKQLEEGVLAVIDLTPSDPYEICYKYFGDFRRLTCVGTENLIMNNHLNDWDENHPECPGRLHCIIERIVSLSLLSRCELLVFIEPATIDDVALVQFPDLFINLKRISEIDAIEERENEATIYDGVYFSKGTFEAAIQALTWTIDVTRAVIEGCFHNGFAIVRPPGHHARPNAYEGYCYFNNVAIAAERVIQDKLCKKIMIIDFDVHHGDGTQEIFYRRNDVLYFSIHRYEHGRFWPNLRESNFDFIGEEEGKGFNINVPLNGTKLRDADYLSIVFNLLLPVAYEYNPDLIMISAGYDAAIGCPEGEMLLSPGFYSHVVSLLSGVANGQIVMVLEGGYFQPSLSEGAAMSLKGLLGDPCPLIEEGFIVQRNVIDTILNCKGALYPHWHCFSVMERFEYETDFELNDSDEHIVAVKYFGEVGKAPFETRDYYPSNDQQSNDEFNSAISSFQHKEENYKVFKGTGYAYEQCTSLHAPDKISNSYEIPDRLTKILRLMGDADIIKYLIEIKMPTDRNDIQHCLKVHEQSYLDQVLATRLTTRPDLYVNEHTANAALTSVGVLLSLIDAVFAEKITNAAALIRPPGHHASISNAQGFCFINNVAVAARYAMDKFNVRKVLIVDFDVHHGNGTQDIFYTSNEVLYISIHRFDEGNYYPSKPSADAKYVGRGLGEGYNVNIPFSNGPMGNSEYLAAFVNIILPIGYEFRPDLVLVSAGFDAGINDPLGGYNVSPEMFGQFIYLLKPLAPLGRMVVVLEGGYNLNTTGHGMLMCLKALRGQAVPIPNNLFKAPINLYAAQTIRNVINIQKPYWQSLNGLKKISNQVLYCKNETEFSEDLYTLSKYDTTNFDA